MTTTMARLSVVAVVALLLLLSAPGRAQGEEGEDDELEEEKEKEVLDVDLHMWQQFYNENQKLLVLFVRSEKCEKCPAAVQSLAALLGQPELPTDLEVGKSADPSLAAKLEVSTYPTLVYLRDKSYVFYDGGFDLEELIDWLMHASQKVLQRLDDDSFEHLTQASSGATTGDWLVAFYSELCKKVLPSMETLGVRIRARTNVAKVNTAENPVLVDRFKINSCPQVILFKQGKMYRYELPKLDVASLRSFVDGFYRNAKAEAVPGQKSGFDHLTENIADSLKAQLEGENRTYILAGVVAACVLALGVLAMCCRSGLAGQEPKKKKKKRE
ncbi:uncharacterized protein LOC101853718 [Aplysia californica]|uniref:Uncharacterized protein LOC101853718 n=1 Tax=Aplysia californica TaxID=6500 RepID=A0ABM1A696_APLCA|nr:uncharacterized protein LOC101853718 [Aplysia californica]